MPSNDSQYSQLAQQIKQWGKDLGFDAVGISDIDLKKHQQYLQHWLDMGRQGDMFFMEKHGNKRSQPDSLIPGTLRVISVRMDYAPDEIKSASKILQQKETGYISRYALGRDYHKVLRKRLQKLASEIQQYEIKTEFRVFTDSAPVLEKALAEKAGVGWIGKHTNVIHQKTGSWFFLGEIYINLPLPCDTPASNHCGSCQNCIDVCPTQAIIGPYQLDARRCISYLTIELKSAIPIEFRRAIGNRIYGCDDCQLFCPWNKFAQTTKEADFTPRDQLTDQQLITLFSWSEEEFLHNTQGSAIRRIGYISWLRNIAVALGNSDYDPKTINILQQKRQSITNLMLQEHIDWAITQLQSNES